MFGLKLLRGKESNKPSMWSQGKHTVSSCSGECYVVIALAGVSNIWYYDTTPSAKLTLKKQTIELQPHNSLSLFCLHCSGSCFWACVNYGLWSDITIALQKTNKGSYFYLFIFTYSVSLYEGFSLKFQGLLSTIWLFLQIFYRHIYSWICINKLLSGKIFDKF